MLVCAVGDCHGQLDTMYEQVFEMERKFGRQVELVVQVGDFGIWPEPENVDKATKKRGIGDFPKWWREKKIAPRPTIFIAGNHEDFSFLRNLENLELLPNMTFLSWGEVITFRTEKEEIHIGGIGGCYGETSYFRKIVHGGRRRHYLQQELEALTLHQRDAPKLDILMMHDAPEGRCVARAYPSLPPRGEYIVTSSSLGLGSLVGTLQPKICLTGHLHFRTERRINGVCVIGLGLIPGPGSMMLLEFSKSTAEPDIVMEWPEPPKEALVKDEYFEAFCPVFIDEGVKDPIYERLAQQLQSWLAHCGVEAPLHRSLRKQVYRNLADHPEKALLMRALKQYDDFDFLSEMLTVLEARAFLENWPLEALPGQILSEP